MSYKQWPTVVNQTILFDGYDCVRTPNIIVSTNDVGPAKARRRASCAPLKHTITLRLNRVEIAVPAITVEPIHASRTEYQEFKRFVREDLYDGIMNTIFHLPPDDGAPDVYVEKQCRFLPVSGTPPYRTIRLFGDWAYVQFTLEELV